jgi:hypothetical protein
MKRKTSVRSYERRDGTKVSAHDRTIDASSAPKVNADSYQKPAVVDWKVIAKRELEKELGVKTKINSYDDQRQGGEDALWLESISGPGSNGESEWVIFEDDESAERAALAYVREMLEEEPELFNQEWLRNYVYISDTDRRILANEEADSFVGDMDVMELLDQLDWKGEIEEVADAVDAAYESGSRGDDLIEVAVDAQKGTSFETNAEWVRSEMSSIDFEEGVDVTEIFDVFAKLVEEDARDQLLESKYDEVYEALDDPLEYLKDYYGDDTSEIMKLSFISIDFGKAAESAVNEDGVAHFLDGYDNEVVELPSGAEAYGTN